MKDNVEYSHIDFESACRRELDVLSSRLDDMSKRIEFELTGLDARLRSEIEISTMRVANRVMEEAVKKAFSHLGVDIDDPKDLQIFRDDLRFGGVFRCAAAKSFYALLIAIFGGIGVSIWLAFKDQFGWK